MATDRPLHEPRTLGGGASPSARKGLPQASLPAPHRQTVFSDDPPSGRNKGRGTRQRDGEDRPFPSIPGGDRAAHATDQAVADAKPQPKPLPRRLGGDEGLEQS